MSNNGSKLSPIPYLKHNKGRTSALIISLGAFGLLCYVLSYFMATFYEPGFEHVLGQYEKISLYSLSIDAGEYETTEQWDQMAKEKCTEVRDQIREITGNDDVFVIRRRHFQLKLPIGASEGQTLFFENKDDMKKYSDRIGAKLVSGRMPEAEGELVVDTNTYKNRGDDILSDLSSKYKIVGQVDCDYYVMYGFPVKAENNYCFMTLNRTPDEDITEDLKANGFNVTGEINKNSVETSLKDSEKVFDNIRLIFSLVSIVLLSLCIIVVLALHIRDRHEEWCLFTSIGFSSGEVYLMAVKELLISFAAAILLAALLSAVTVICCDKLLLGPLGLQTNTFRPEDIGRVLVYFFAIFAMCQIPLFVQLSKITTVDDIE